jgi:hypothetical protein
MSRALAAKFRKHVIALPAGSRFEWRDMDAWAKANRPANSSYWEGFCVWEGLCVECMGLAEKLEKEGWLTYQNPEARTGDSDAYFRTAKTESQPWD